MPTPPAELAFEALKGADAVADVLVAAASAADCDLHLALVSITESGSAEHIGYYGSRRRRWSDEEDEEDFEVSEVHDRHETLSDWRRPDGSQPNWGTCPLWRMNSVRPMPLKTWSPTSSISTRRLATKVPPSSVPTAGRPWCCGRAAARRPQPGGPGRDSALPGRTDRALDSKWRRSRIALWREAHELSGHMLRAWPRQVGWYPGRTEARSDAATLLTLVSQQDTARIDTFLDILAAGAYSKGDNAAIVRAAGLLPPSTRRCSSTSSPARPRRT